MMDASSFLAISRPTKIDQHGYAIVFYDVEASIDL
jgi:hypothetical protein